MTQHNTEQDIQHSQHSGTVGPGFTHLVPDGILHCLAAIHFDVSPFTDLFDWTVMDMVSLGFSEFGR
jgi:hypothetical protein